MIRSLFLDGLQSPGFNEFTLEALAEDWSEGLGSSPYVICVEHSQPKSPENLLDRQACHKSGLSVTMFAACPRRHSSDRGVRDRSRS